jgi:hypothetical protein
MECIMSRIQSVCVYCGSGDGRSPVYLAAARTLGEALARSGIRLVYGGGSTGLMGTLANATLAAGGRVTGIIPQFLVDRERANQRVTDMIVTANMHERKWAMFEASDAFVALPGGIGTLEELIEMLTWAQLGRHDKKVIIADIDGFWQHLRALLGHMNEEGFLHSLSQLRPVFVERIEDVLPSLLAN